MINYYKKLLGFTFVEIILVVALLAVSSGMVAPIYFSAKNKDDLSNSVHIVVSSLRRAQLFSMAVKEDSSWGVKMVDNDIVIFKGDNYLSREVEWDESFSINKNISQSGIDEIFFSKLNGRPNVNGDIVLGNNSGNSLIININSLGVVNY